MPTNAVTASKGAPQGPRAGAGPQGKGAQRGGGQRKRPRRQSEYGVQLAEKQQTKRMFGLRERQFRRYFELASKTPEATGEKLLQLLETRLDNVVYRLGYGRSLAQARQMVNHGHVHLNGKRASIPSQAVSVGDSITVTMTNVQRGEGEVPGWLKVHKGTELGGTLQNLPTRQEIPLDVNEQLIVEFYSR